MYGRQKRLLFENSITGNRLKLFGMSERDKSFSNIHKRSFDNVFLGVGDGSMKYRSRDLRNDNNNNNVIVVVSRRRGTTGTQIAGWRVWRPRTTHSNNPYNDDDVVLLIINETAPLSSRYLYVLLCTCTHNR